MDWRNIKLRNSILGLGSKTKKLFNLLVLLNFKAIKVSILSVNTTNKLSFVKLNLRELSRKGPWFLNLLRSLFG